MRALNRVFKGRARGDQPTLPEKVKRILRKYGATLLMPGPSGILQYGFQPGNYRESTGQTLAAVDQQVGFVVDAAQSPGPELMTNGDFSNGLTGWSSIGTGGTRTVVSGRVQITGGVGPGLRQGGLISGRAYRASMYARRISGTANAFVTGGGLNPAGATVTWVFNASATNFDFGISGDSSTTTWEFGEISVRELPGILASQPTSGFQPYLRQSGGVNSWQFDGTDDRLSLSAVPFQMADDHFVVAGATAVSPGATNRRIFSAGGADIDFGNQLFRDFATSRINLRIRDSASTSFHLNGNYAPPENTPFVCGYVKVGNEYTIHSDATTQLHNRSVTPVTITQAAIGGLTTHHSGQIHALIVGKGAITEPEYLSLKKFVASLQGRSL